MAVLIHYLIEGKLWLSLMNWNLGVVNQQRIINKIYISLSIMLMNIDESWSGLWEILNAELTIDAKSEINILICLRLCIGVRTRLPIQTYSFFCRSTYALARIR